MAMSSKNTNKSHTARHCTFFSVYLVITGPIVKLQTIYGLPLQPWEVL